MTPKWLSGLVKARQAEEDSARARLAVARRSAARAEAQARAEAARLAALQELDAEQNAAAFVAAAVAVQSAAATLATAVSEAVRADGWARQRHDAVVDAARSRRTAEELAERTRAAAARAAAVRAQHEQDEIAAGVHRRAVARSDS